MNKENSITRMILIMAFLWSANLFAFNAFQCGGFYSLVDQTNSVFYSVTDPRLLLHAKAVVDPIGGLDLDFHLKGKKGKRSKFLSGQDQLDKIMAHFQGEFSHINGVWVAGDNLNEFNRLTRSRVSVEEAALQTWTGKQAVARGYSIPIIDTLEGRRGSYSLVRVRFMSQPE